MRYDLTVRRIALALVAIVVIAGCSSSNEGSSPDDASTNDSSSPLDAGADSIARDTRSGDGPIFETTDDATPPRPDDVTQITATSGWQIYPGGGYRYGPSIVMNDDGSIEMFTCSPGASGAWDFIRWRHSTDGGHTWTDDVVALQPTPGTRDAFSTCDPGAIHVGAYWYVGYTSTENAKGTQNHLYVARASSPGGPYDKWNGTGWGGAPQPIVTYTGNPDFYGVGEPSLVFTDSLYVFYTWADDTGGHTNLSIAPDPTKDDWPLHLTDKGHVIDRRANGEDSTDIKWIDSRKRFVGVTTVDRFGPNATIGVYQSFDGVHWDLAPYRGARAQPGAHNAGISGGPTGHFDPSKSNFVAYAYQPPGKSWGDWPTFVDPIALEAVPFGEPVGGAVSSIVGGATGDWNWSGPRAWDGDESTIFSSDAHGATDAAEEWAAVDLGKPMTVKGVTLVPRAGGYGFPVDFSIQSASTPDAFVDVAGETLTAFPTPTTGKVTRTFGAPVVARWLRVHATRLGADDFGNHYLQLAEIEPF